MRLDLQGVNAPLGPTSESPLDCPLASRTATPFPAKVFTQGVRSLFLSQPSPGPLLCGPMQGSRPTMATGQGQLEIPRYPARQGGSSCPGGTLSNQAKRAKRPLDTGPGRPIRRRRDIARGLSQRRRSRKILLRSAGLLPKIHATAPIAAAKVLFTPLLQGFSHGRAARTTLAEEACRPEQSRP